LAILTENIREKLIRMFGVIAEEEGLEVFDIALARRNAGWTIKVVLDRLDGYVTVDDCARLSRRFTARLELEQLITGEYRLEVSSPGLDRPLRGPDDYGRFKGETAKLVFAVSSGSEVVIGRILEADEASVTLLTDDDERRIIKFTEIKKANLEVVIPGFGVHKKRVRRKKKAK
jgi:ribosome maturation factor RimP